MYILIFIIWITDKYRFVEVVLKLSIPRIFRRVCNIAEIDSTRRRVCSSVRMEQLSSHWTDFHENSYLNIFFLKSVEKVQVSLTADKKMVKPTLHEDQ
jgi:hypothetical protein